MKERPILFSGPMVRAILEGRKTQTRRVVKLPERFLSGDVAPITNGKSWAMSKLGKDGGYIDIVCPFGQPGDRLWVREAWYGERDGGNGVPCVAYAADGIQKPEGCRWRPSIHMPRWASRLTLEIAAVRVELLQDISEEDAKAEGAERGNWSQSLGMFMEPCDDADDKRASHKDGFGFLWSSIYGHESWDANPWVWVVEFRKAEDKR